VSARAVLIEVQAGHQDERFKRGRHWEIEWQGAAGNVRSGQWYGPIEVRRVAEDCHPSEIEVRALP
jgi:hypothetical protein